MTKVMTKADVRTISNSDLDRYVNKGGWFAAIEAYEKQICECALPGSIHISRELIANQIRLERTPDEAALYLRIAYLESQAHEVLELAAYNNEFNKINTIRMMRIIHGWGLKEAKDYVEAAMRNGEEYRAKHTAPPVPDKFDFLTDMLNRVASRVEDLEAWQRKVKGGVNG